MAEIAASIPGRASPVRRSHRDTMGSEVEAIEERLKSLLGQLKTECSVFERIVYKNKNQHRRSGYFQYLLKVRRDLRLLQSVKLEEILSSCFQVILGSKPKQKVNLLESLKRRKCEGAKYNFMERLLGAARLLSQMVEPITKGAMEISILLARSFFTGFSITVLALLARLRVLVQQVLLDVVSVFNMVSSLSQKKQSVKITQDGIEVFREFYPTNEEYVTLECIRETDKFVLLEKAHKSDSKSRDDYLGEEASLGASVVQYQSIKCFLEDIEVGSKTADGGSVTEEVPTHFIQDTSTSLPVPLGEDEALKQVECFTTVGDDLATTGSSSKNLGLKDSVLAGSCPSQGLNLLKPKSGSTSKVAFVTVKKPTPTTANHLKNTEKSSSNINDPFCSLLTAGNLKDSIF